VRFTLTGPFVGAAPSCARVRPKTPLAAASHRCVRFTLTGPFVRAAPSGTRIRPITPFPPEIEGMTKRHVAIAVTMLLLVAADGDKTYSDAGIQTGIHSRADHPRVGGTGTGDES